MLVRRRRRRLTLRRILWFYATNDRDLQLCCCCWYFVPSLSLLCCFCIDNNTAHALNMETLKRLTFYRLKGNGGRRGVLGTGWVGGWHAVLTSESAQKSKAWETFKQEHVENRKYWVRQTRKWKSNFPFEQVWKWRPVSALWLKSM